MVLLLIGITTLLFLNIHLFFALIGLYFIFKNLYKFLF